ncbi:MAG: hypothetical protein ACI4SF_05150 [Oscillospiraceae bacterium]
MGNLANEICEKLFDFHDIRDGTKALQKHFGEGIFVTATLKDKKKEHKVSEDKLRDGEISAVVYSIGNYAIRESVMLYKDNNDTYYSERVPAEKESVDAFRNNESYVDYKNREVREIHAKYLKDPSAKWHFICLATSAIFGSWDERIDFIGTVKKSVFDSDKGSDLVVRVKYVGESGRFGTWYRLKPDGSVKKYSGG